MSSGNDRPPGKGKVRTPEAASNLEIQECRNEGKAEWRADPIGGEVSEEAAVRAHTSDRWAACRIRA